MFDARGVINAVMQAPNPNQVLGAIAQRSPEIRYAMNLVNGKTAKQVKNMAYQMARENGIDLNALAKSMGVKLPD